MIGELIAWLVMAFLVNPLTAEVQSRLAEANAPPAVVAQVAACGASAAPVLLQRATEDPWWAIRTGLATWIGTTSPDAVLAEAAPRCVPAMQAARPYLPQG
ncbi:hypothetical protein [Falsiroseomonas tokyonensis]|uniref:CNNM transmembrane domain-containing protein n=1 Tax=Falsiroseomonas tokyonensis TaxID=430521 RepID=A0ABV7C2V2_9PROT|nr:hypothetical protein [Falsiroseomonas tokyonensis]MBU8541557.1 hypothetical protein [Falsiroseomonas tokyonensis]